MMEFSDRQPDTATARSRFAGLVPLPGTSRPVIATCRAWIVRTAARLITPHCPRCGAGKPEASASPRPEHDPVISLRCRDCAHRWDVLPQDPFLGP